MIPTPICATMITFMEPRQGQQKFDRMTHGEVQIVDIRKDGRDGQHLLMYSSEITR